MQLSFVIYRSISSDYLLISFVGRSDCTNRNPVIQSWRLQHTLQRITISTCATCLLEQELWNSFKGKTLIFVSHSNVVWVIAAGRYRKLQTCVLRMRTTELMELTVAWTITPSGSASITSLLKSRDQWHTSASVAHTTSGI
jgi:hypothetical protein